MAKWFAQMTDATPFVLKKADSNRGNHVFVVHSRAEFYAKLRSQCTASSKSEGHDWVLQRYVKAPLLLYGRKNHLRAYIVAVGNDFWMYKVTGTPGL